MIILTAVHQRPEIFEIFLKNIPVKYALVVVGDVKDYCYNVWFRWAKDRPANSTVYVPCENLPLGRKWNAGLEFIRELDIDYVFISGSDDIFSPDFYDYYESQKGRFHFVGVLDFYFYDYGRKSLKYFHGFQKDRQGETHGAGRMIHKSVLEQVDYKLWDEVNIALDASMTKRLSEIEFTRHEIRMRDLDIFGIDIKTEINLHSIDEYNGNYVQKEQRELILNQFKW